MKQFKADLHIHSCLSPCADLDMSPRAIVEKSVQRGLDIIAVCDHNTAENAGAVIRAGTQQELTVLPGMEINSREEVHTLAIFDSEIKALAMQEIVYRSLKGTNRPDIFGEQVVANEFDEVDGFNDRLLIGATQIGLQEIVREVHRLGGLSIASHVDRPSFSILSQLGFIPSDIEFDALEISRYIMRESICSKLQIKRKLPLLVFSDAHVINDIGRATTDFFLKAATIDEISMAFAEKSGRRVGD